MPEFRFEVDFKCPDCGEENCDTVEQSEEKEYHEVYCFSCNRVFTLDIEIS